MNMSKNIPVLFVIVAACLISTVYCCSLEYTCRQANYLVANPDITIYDSVNANYGVVTCDAVMSEDKRLISIGSCGTSNGMVHFIGGGTVLTCTLGDCVEETGLANSFSTALDFALNSIKIAGASSVQYLCHTFGVIFIKNPRRELYYHSTAYSIQGKESCETSHLLQNEVIEIYNCDISGGDFIISMGASPSVSLIITRKSDLHLLNCPEIVDDTTAPTVIGGGDSPTPYSCYSDGTILIENPRAELYSYGYAESNGAECPTLYIDGGDKLIVYDCNLNNLVVAVMSKIPIISSLIMRKSNIFLIDCSSQGP